MRIELKYDVMNVNTLRLFFLNKLYWEFQLIFFGSLVVVKMDSENYNTPHPHQFLSPCSITTGAIQERNYIRNLGRRCILLLLLWLDLVTDSGY